MLVLTRRAEESILIGDDIEIKVLQVRGAGDQAAVRIGIVAPRSVSVLRKEVRDAVAAENRRASTQSTATDLSGLFSGAQEAGRGDGGFQNLGGLRAAPQAGEPRRAPPPRN